MTVSRIHKDDEQQWRTSDSFGRDDLLLLAKALDHAHTWNSEQARGQEVPFSRQVGGPADVMSASLPAPTVFRLDSGTPLRPDPR